MENFGLCGLLGGQRVCWPRLKLYGSWAPAPPPPPPTHTQKKKDPPPQKKKKKKKGEKKKEERKNYSYPYVVFLPLCSVILYFDTLLQAFQNRFVIVTGYKWQEWQQIKQPWSITKGLNKLFLLATKLTYFRYHKLIFSLVLFCFLSRFLPIFLLPKRHSLFYFFRGAGKFCLANGLRQLTRDAKSDVRTLNFRTDVIFASPRKPPNDDRKRSLCNVKCQKWKKWRITNYNF